MRRLGQVIVALVLGTLWTAHPAQAQAPEPAWSLQVDAAATLGHTSSSSFGGEVDRRLGSSWDLVFEAGHMTNIASGALQDRADIIGTQIAATANPAQSAAYYDVGLQYRLMPDGKWNPYVLLAFGGARVNTTTTFSINGVELTPDQLAANLVSLGADLDGRITKAMVVMGLGARVPFGRRLFLDGSYRYGRIFPRSGEIDGDTGVNTQRLQIGLGMRF